MLVLALLVVPLNGLAVHDSSSISPIDETGWINQLIKGSRFEVVTPGELMVDESIREFCQRGHQLFSWPACPDHGRIDASDYVYKGVEISEHSPFYFLITGPIARALRSTPIDLPPNDSIVTWGRLLGSAWLLLGLYFTLRIGELLALSRRAMILAIGFLIVTPALWHASTIVNPDQTAIPSGAAMLLAGLSWEKSGRRLWLVGLVALLGAALDPTNAVAILLVLIYLGVRAAQRRWRSGDSESVQQAPRAGAQLVVVAMLVLAVYLASKGWDRFKDWLYEADVIKPSSRLRNIDHNPVAQVVTQHPPTIGRAFGFTTPFAMFPPFESWIPRDLYTAPYVAWAAASKLIAVGVIALATLGSRLRDRIGAITFATTITLLVSPTLIVLRDWLETSNYLEPAARYGLGTVPALAVIIAATTERWASARIVVTVGAVGLYLSALFSVF